MGTSPPSNSEPELDAFGLFRLKFDMRASSSGSVKSGVVAGVLLPVVLGVLETELATLSELLLLLPLMPLLKLAVSDAEGRE